MTKITFFVTVYGSELSLTQTWGENNRYLYVIGCLDFGHNKYYNNVNALAGLFLENYCSFEELHRTPVTVVVSSYTKKFFFSLSWYRIEHCFPYLIYRVKDCGLRANSSDSVKSCLVQEKSDWKTIKIANSCQNVFPPNRLLHPWRASKETCVHVDYPVELRRRRRMSGVPGFPVHSSHYTLRTCVLSEMYWGRNQDFRVESSLSPLPRLYWNGCTSGSTPWGWGMYWWNWWRRRVALELQGLISHRDYQHVARFSKVPVTFRVRNKIFKPVLKNENAHPSQQTSPFCFVKW